MCGNNLDITSGMSCICLGAMCSHAHRVVYSVLYLVHAYSAHACIGCRLVLAIRCATNSHLQADDVSLRLLRLRHDGNVAAVQDDQGLLYRGRYKRQVDSARLSSDHVLYLRRQCCDWHAGGALIRTAKTRPAC